MLSIWCRISDSWRVPIVASFFKATVQVRNLWNEGKTLELIVGYMAPEYAMDGVFSVKSDVFSYGVLVIEIITGQRNKGVYLSNPDFCLLGKASMEPME
ncbi:hypothetical protein J5N97_028307 [Dioscorea zingiberensis]|uniref:Serine-threonine/tyrosine-protein kinase catalytic domain-containing protein n=1 Tax=Dioscorea zingiberensis TaxID=325984 RepID=A0A9D5BYR0_9LILI|nr:hypothetical protein J5N97_028307 [Dioscorea zingiberensis]